MLRDAGWPDGFRIVLETTSDRYPNDGAIAQAIASQGTRLGLKVEVESMPGAVFFGRASKQEFSAFTAQNGAEDAATGMRALIASWDPARGFGTANRTRYTNPVIDDRLSAAQTTMDEAKRNALLAKTIELAMAETPLIPVFYPIFDFAAKKSLVVTPRPQRRFQRADDSAGAAAVGMPQYVGMWRAPGSRDSTVRRRRPGVNSLIAVPRSQCF